MFNKNLINLMNIIKKNTLNTLVIILLFFVFTQEFNIYRNVFYLITKSHDERATKAYEKTFFSGYCEGSSHGYLLYIKKKYSKIFENNKLPKIVNNFNGKKEYWVFKNLKAKIDENYVIVLNGNKFKKFENYKILDQHENKCFFIERIND